MKGKESMKMKLFRLFVFWIVLSCWIPHVASEQIVHIPDPILAIVLRDELGLARDASITKSKMQTLYRLSVSDWDIIELTGERQWITDLTGLEHATQLSWLAFHSSLRLKDLGPLSGLTQLKYLELSFGSISDLRPLSGLTQLTTLDLTGNNISDLASLKGLTQLTTLEVSYNPINDFSPLSGLTQLRTLQVFVTNEELMNNLHSQVDLTQLRDLAIIGEGNPIGDLHPFANLIQLERFVVYNTQIRDIAPLKGLTQLKYLSLGRTQIRDITPLAALTQLEHLHLNDNQIDNVSPLSGLTNLQVLGIRNNQIRDITPIKDLSATLWLEGNPIGEPPEDAPNLVVESIRVSRLGDEERETDMILSPGEEFFLHVTVKIKGTSTSDTTKVLYYHSDNKGMPHKDQVFLKGEPVSLAGKDEFSQKLKSNAPPTEGLYYYWGCVNSVADESDTEDNCSKAITIRVKIPVNAPNRKVHVIWYYPKNEDLRGDASRGRWDGVFYLPRLTDYITPNNVETHLEDVAKFFGNQLGETFEFDRTSGGDINVREIQSAQFYANRGNTSNINQGDFSDEDPDFYNKLWIDIENRWNNLFRHNPFDPSQNIYLVLVQSNYNPSGSLFNRGSADINGGRAMVRLGEFEKHWSDEIVKTTIAHELGHVFGLYHDFSEKVIMSYDFEKGGGIFGNLAELDSEQFSQRSKNWLEIHRDLSGSQSSHISVDSPMRIKVNNQPFGRVHSGISPGGAINLAPDTSTGSPQYKINVQLVDTDGLRQVELIAPMLKDACCAGTSSYNPSKYVLAKYLTVDKSDHNNKVAGYFTDPVRTYPVRWIGDIDITEWVEESLERGEDELKLFFTAIDRKGNIFTTDWVSLCISQTLVGDVTGDGQVTIQDVVIVAGAMGEKDHDADVNCDGQVNIQDLVAVAAAIGQGAAAPAAIRQQATGQLTATNVQHWLTQAQQLDLKNPIMQRGILFFQYLLAALTPQETALLLNYPNPFNPETWIPYQLATPAEVNIAIYAVDGTLVRTLALGHQPVGIYEGKSRAAYWDGKNSVGESVASGVYFYTLTVGEFTATRKMLIRK